MDKVIFNIGSKGADFPHQVEQWIAATKDSAESPDAMFAIFFGVNDLWKYSAMDRDHAAAAMMDTLDTLFDQLGEVANHWPEQYTLRIFIPKLVDMYAASTLCSMVIGKLIRWKKVLFCRHGENIGSPRIRPGVPSGTPFTCIACIMMNWPGLRKNGTVEKLCCGRQIG